MCDGGQLYVAIGAVGASIIVPNPSPPLPLPTSASSSPVFLKEWDVVHPGLEGAVVVLYEVRLHGAQDQGVEVQQLRAPNRAGDGSGADDA